MESGSPQPTPAAAQGHATSGASELSPNEWINKEIENRLIVATLVASVTFAACITLPGGYNVSSDPHPGSPTMLHNRGFQVFIIFDAFATYTSILSVLALLQARSADLRRARENFNFAGEVLSFAVIFMTVAFSASIFLAVSKINWLKIFILCVGVLYAVVIYFVAGYHMMSRAIMQSGN